jgi:PKD repeat protein
MQLYYVNYHLFDIFTTLNWCMTRNFIFLIQSFLLAFFATAQNPVANFNANPLSACANAPIVFNSTSVTGGGAAITSYAWDFGDGFSGSGTTVSHSYAAPGTYTVTLVVTNANGAADAEVKPNYITIQPSPTANFSVNGLGCTVPLTVNFSNTGSSGAGFSYQWNFGNGQTSTAANPSAQTYNSAGTYSVSLITTNTTTGCKDTLIQSIVVSNFQTNFQMPTTACVGQSIPFMDNSTAGANQWSWNFGGMGVSSEENPSFTFMSAGTYSVQLSSQNTASGCSGSSSQTITVQPTPIPSFTATPLTNCAPSNVTFNNTSVGGTSYSWNFGDATSLNNTSTEVSPSHTYNNNGSYDVTLIMTTIDGCSGTLTLDDYIVIANLDPVILATPTGGCTPLVVTFTDETLPPNSSNPITSWNWSFPGGTPNSFNGQNPPSVTYGIGVYDVSLTVTTQSGCTETLNLNDYITVGDIIDLNFSVDTTVNCIKTDFEFTSNVTTNPANPNPSEISYFWDFTDGTSTEENPQYQFTSDTGYFDVQLVVDFRGCKDSIQIDSLIYINAPIAKFSPDQTLYCNVGSSVLVPFIDDATHGITSDDILMIYEWGDGTPNTVLDDPQLDDVDAGNVSHQYTNYGSYTVEQVIHNYTTGCSDSITSIVHISTVNANFYYSTDSICQGDTLAMFDNSTSWATHPLEEWEFNMGDNPPGVVNMGDTAYYAYTSPIFSIQGYTITLTATNEVGCSDQATLPITVLPTPFPVLSLPDPSVGCAPFEVTLTNNTMSFGMPIDYFIYSYSDNANIDTVDYIPFTPPNPNPNTITHSFVDEGFNNLTMTVVDVFGCYAVQASASITITKPFASFSMDNVICNGDSLLTENSSTGVEPLTYEWFDVNPVGANAISTDTNATASFTVSNVPFGQTSAVSPLYLVVTDGNGCKDTVSNLLSISIPWAVPNYTFSGAAIGPNGEFVCPPLFGTYIDSSFSYGNIVEWNWNFGNGNQSVLQNPSNTYALPGTYDLYLEVTDENGCKADTTLLEYVTIGGPYGEPDWLQQVGQCAQGALFVVNNALNVDSSYWELGDGGTLSDTIGFFYNYGEPGTYTPGVYLYDSTGCEVFYPLDPITVLDDGLNAFFTATPNPADQDETITFVDGSTSQQSTVVSWIWEFDQDVINSFTDTNQYYAFPLAGQYSVTLTVYDALGCADEYTLIINIKDPEIWVPNVITTNDDGINDLFTLPFDGFNEYEIVIVNRWGNTIHVGTRDPLNPLLLWDGTTDSSGDKVVDGVYFWHLTGTMLGGTPVDKHGNVTVLESGQ